MGGGPSARRERCAMEFARALIEARCDPASHTESGWAADAGFTDEGTQEVRPTRGAQAIPIQQALIRNRLEQAPPVEARGAFCF